MRARTSPGSRRRGSPRRAAEDRPVPNHRERRHLPYSPELVYALVADVERYPEFLPWCTAVRVMRRKPIEVEAGREGEQVLADLFVRFKMVRERFTSDVTLDPERRAISIRYIDGPFRHLTNEWVFSPENEGCRIDFYIDFEFKSRALALLISALFDEAIRKLVGAFEARAHDLYGGRRSI